LDTENTKDLDVIHAFRTTSALLEKTCLEMTNNAKIPWKVNIREKLILTKVMTAFTEEMASKWTSRRGIVLTG
jgi:hypothetical protein